jgi:serine protease Do
MIILVAAWAADETALTMLDELSSSLGRVSESVLPSVVTIISRTVIAEDEGNVPVSILLNSEMDPFGADQVYQNPDDRRTVLVLEEQASGVIISSDGYIVTSNHAVSGAYEVEVHLNSGEVLLADLVGGDPGTDIALIRIAGDDYRAIAIGDSDHLVVGQFILSFGSPFSLTQTMSFGIISYLGRCELGLVDYENYIQTDVLLNPGSSGGALVNLNGELVGINSAIATNIGSYHGIGFAIPVNQAMWIVEEIVDRGEVTRGYLGLMMRPLAPGQMIDYFNYEEGLFVAVVLPGSVSEIADIRRGDLLLAIDGISIESINDFSFQIAELRPGDTVELDIMRADTVLNMLVTLEERPDDQTFSSITPFTGISPGWAVSDLDDGSVRIDRVGVIGSADEAGLESGDIILAVNHSIISGVEDLYLSMIRSGTEVLLTVSREGRILYVSLRY